MLMSTNRLQICTAIIELQRVGGAERANGARAREISRWQRELFLYFAMVVRWARAGRATPVS